MKYFIDTEFSERGPKYPIELISLGIVSEKGDEFYAINADWYRFLAHRRASKWVQDNVLIQLPRCSNMNSPRMKSEYSRIMTISEMRDSILNYIGTTSPEFWGYYSDYDWVVFCQIFGDMMHLPSKWPMYCMDLKQLCVEFGNPKLPNLPVRIEHHALYDAREIKFRYEWLREYIKRGWNVGKGLDY